MFQVHGYVRDNYRFRFPELESLVLHPVDYARVVQRLIIGNDGSNDNGVSSCNNNEGNWKVDPDVDITQVDLEGLLPSATIMVVSVTASTTSGAPLSYLGNETVDANDETLSPLKRALLGCEMILRLDEDKKQVQDFVASKMEMIAPNMSRYRRVC